MIATTTRISMSVKPARLSSAPGPSGADICPGRGYRAVQVQGSFHNEAHGGNSGRTGACGSVMKGWKNPDDHVPAARRGREGHPVLPLERAAARVAQPHEGQAQARRRDKREGNERPAQEQAARRHHSGRRLRGR